MRETDKPFVSVSRYLYPFIMLMKLLPIISIITSSILSIPYSLAQEKRTNNSPLYFGPNALPVPHMLEGRVSSRIYTELAYELGSGFYGDCTRTISAKINIALFSPRINLSLWMPVIEFYKNSSESLILQDSPNKRIKGYEIGNVYISTDIHVIKQSKIRPDITIRAVRNIQGIMTLPVISSMLLYLNQPNLTILSSKVGALRSMEDFYVGRQVSQNRMMLTCMASSRSFTLVSSTHPLPIRDIRGGRIMEIGQ